MTVWRLVRKEIGHRKLNFALGVLSVLVAVGVVVVQFTLLRAHDARTEDLLQSKQAEADKRLAKLEDDYRKYMKELGFNLLVLPAEQDLTEFWEKGYATATMPEENVRKLSQSGSMIIRHLLPIVQQKVFWEEQKRRVILIGTRGEVPLTHRRPKEPMLLAVPEGKVVVGFQLASDLSLKPGEKITLLGRDFVIHKRRPYRGSPEDATIWVDLKAGQELLGMQGRLNAIEALKCRCEKTTTAQVQKEVAGYLNDEVKVVVRENEVTIRAKARDRAKAEHDAAIAAEKIARARLRKTRESFAGVVVPLVLAGSAVWIGFLTLSNVRERTGEIGILRAIGVRSGHIFAVFLAKAFVIGLIGSVVGYCAGLVVSVAAARIAPSLRVQAPWELFAPGLLAAVVTAAPLVAMLASWAPATMAARQDPAVILSKE
jgi:putative ABC transport system permease protein